MPHLNERQQRIAAALEARWLGYGGVSAVAGVSGLARGTIHRGLKELGSPHKEAALDRVRGSGGGRKTIAAQNPRIVRRLQFLVEANTRGDPMTPLLGTCRSTGELARALSEEGYEISADTVGRLLPDLG